MNDKYISPFTDFGFKKLFGTELNKDFSRSHAPRGNAVQTRQRHRFKFDEFNHLYPFLHYQ